jgi:amino acid permease
LGFCGVIFVINVFCIAVVISYISKKNKEAQEGKIEDLGYKKQLIRFVFIFLLNIIAIVISCTFLIFDVFDNVTNQSIYLGACLIIDICYSINKTVYNETLKIFCKCKKTNQGNDNDQFINKNTFNELEDMTDNDDDN